MDLAQLRQQVAQGSWQDRLDAIRAVPHNFAGRDHQDAYAAAAGAYYVGALAPHFHLVPWLDKYADHPGFVAAYDAAAAGTSGFTQCAPADIEAVIRAHPPALRIFRLMTGYSVSELAEAVSALGGVSVSGSVIDRLESGGAITARHAAAIAAVASQLHGIIAGTGGFHVPGPMQAQGFRGKTDKPDTAAGWTTVADWHANRVPYAELLYQRFYGGSFRQLQDAGGSRKGDLLEDATEELFRQNRVPYVRTVSGTQASVGSQFGVSIRPAPDFVIHDGHSPRALLECKSAGDGGTARDKAGRFVSLRNEANRLGGAAVIAVLDGFGWRRLPDALGPVVRDCGGLVFSAANLTDLLSVEPVASLVGTGPPP
jgi:hypothetical protein